MKNLYLLILIGALPSYLAAQNSTIKGKLVDTTGQLLSGATVSVLQQKDSSLVSYAMSDEKGLFEVKNVAAGDYILAVSYTGYQTHKEAFSFIADKRI